MTDIDLQNYACPQCGYDGPHPVLGKEASRLIVECGNIECAAEFMTAMPDFQYRP